MSVEFKDTEYEIPEVKAQGITYYYDGVIIDKGRKILIEIQGDLHRKETSWKTLERTQKSDKNKKQFAQKYDYELITIDVDYKKEDRNNIKINSFNQFRDNFIKSKLNEYYDIENTVDWDEVLRKTQSNLVKEVCEYYDNNQNLTIKDLEKQFFLKTEQDLKNIGIQVSREWINKNRDKIKIHYISPQIYISSIKLEELERENKRIEIKNKLINYIKEQKTNNSLSKYYEDFLKYYNIILNKKGE